MKSFYLFLAVCFSAAPCLAAPAVQDPSLKVEQVVFGLSLPTTMAFIGPDDILVLQLSDGRVRRVIGGVLQPGEVLDVAVDNDGERGLLGIALHPDFATNHFVYLYYTESSTGSDGGSPLGNRVYRYTWDGSALISPTLIVDLPVLPGANHNGGVIAFGPDEKLYVIIGDLNRNGQLQNFTDIGAPAPDDTSVILRLNDNGTSPTDNPFSSDPNNILSRYYAYGVRNSFGMAFDPVTGELWDTENGENTFDEINLVEPGFNSGWEFIMRAISFRLPARITPIPSSLGSIPSGRRRLFFSTRRRWAISMRTTCSQATSTMAICIIFSRTPVGTDLHSRARLFQIS
jgi:glucose/arabinose dehydrogenase